MEQDGHAEELTQENSDELDTSVKDEELVCYRARRLVPCTELRNGMARLHFLLDTCSPGTLHIPNSPLATVQDLCQTQCCWPQCWTFLEPQSWPGPASSFTAPTLCTSVTRATGPTGSGLR